MALPLNLPINFQFAARDRFAARSRDFVTDLAKAR